MDLVGLDDELPRAISQDAGQEPSARRPRGPNFDDGVEHMPNVPCHEATLAHPQPGVEREVGLPAQPRRTMFRLRVADPPSRLAPAERGRGNSEGKSEELAARDATAGKPLHDA